MEFHGWSFAARSIDNSTGLIDSWKYFFFAIRQKGILSSHRLPRIFGGLKGIPMHLWGLTPALIFNNNINTENLEDFPGFPWYVATFHFYITTNCRLALLLCQGHWYDVTFRLFAARSGSQERAWKIIKWQIFGFYSKTIYYQLILFIYIYMAKLELPEYIYNI